MSIRSRKRFGGNVCAAAAVVAAMFCAAPGAAASEPPGDQPAAALHSRDGHPLTDADLHIDLGPTFVSGGDVAGRIEMAGTNGGGDDARPAAEGTAIPLPPPLLIGLIGLGISGIAARRRRRSGR
jgi:hypothetical protein